ncbi:MAG: hypothetical protein NTY30_00705 [Candidatus Berkelbacteria bacterium]|nr:hypothetical protein [Candidatus Berkelbacteria bacterium]
MVDPREQKLREILATDRKALQVIRNHPGQSFEQIKQSVDLNISAHVSTNNHIGLFVYNVLHQKSDLKSLADTAAKRIILSDARIEAVFAKLSVDEKAVQAEKIYNIILTYLVSYFTNLKGQKLNAEAITDELTVAVTKKVAETLGHFEPSA